MYGFVNNEKSFILAVFAHRIRKEDRISEKEVVRGAQEEVNPRFCWQNPPLADVILN
jgi:hypothetical protein